MIDDTNEIMLDLLCKQAAYGLTEEEKKQLYDLGDDIASDQAASLEATAAMIALAGVDGNQPMPTHLAAKISDSADEYFDALPGKGRYADRSGELVSGTPSRSIIDWLGWLVAAAACVALAINIYQTRVQQPESARTEVPTTAPTVDEQLTPAQMRQRLMETAPDLIRAEVAGLKDYQNVGGDIVWSDSEQTGYMNFRNLPVNDKTKETYQLWIIDESQDPKTPIDGGTFDVDQNGEIIIPINARLKAKNPKAFAVTVEKPGGVVVSKQERVAAIGKTHA